MTVPNFMAKAYSYKDLCRVGHYVNLLPPGYDPTKIIDKQNDENLPVKIYCGESCTVLLLTREVEFEAITLLKQFGLNFEV